MKCSSLSPFDLSFILLISILIYNLLLQETSVRHNEREKNVLVDELASQNARLTSQLEAANQLEMQLNNKLQELKSQYSIQHQTLQVQIN